MFLLAPAIQTLCLVMELRVHVSHDRRLLVHHILDFLHLLWSLVVRRSVILDILFSLIVRDISDKHNILLLVGMHFCIPN